MPAWVAPAALATGAGVISYLSQRDANKRNRAVTKMEMGFAEKMSSTAYQRSMADMRKAGLNPMLAYQQGGASTPGAQGPSMEGELEGAVASAQDARRLSAELKESSSRRELMYNQALAARNSAERDSTQSQMNIKAQRLQLLQAEILKLQIPALQNSAKVEGTRLGKDAAFLDRLRQAILGGRGFFNPIG